MSPDGRDSWRLTAIAMVVLVVAALLSGLIVATWTEGERLAPRPRAGRGAPVR